MFALRLFYCHGREGDENKFLRIKQKQLGAKLRVAYVAVKGGFEPPVRLPVRQFSKLLV